MTFAYWALAFGISPLLRLAIRAHYRRWWRSQIPRRPVVWARRALIDPLTPIIPTRRLFT